MAAVREQLKIRIWMVVVIGIGNKETAQALIDEGLDAWGAFKDLHPQTLLPYVQWFVERVEHRSLTM